MKKQTLLLAITIIMIACQQKKEIEDETTKDLNPSAMELSMAESPAAYAPPPVREMAKFVPPVIKDDAVEENNATNTSNNTIAKHKKIIKDGSMAIKVKDVQAAKKRMDAIVKAYNAYYENESFNNYEVRVSYDLKIRVPAKQFDSFLNASEKGEGEIITKNINARDVTEEYVDGEIRLNSKKLFRNRYNQLLEKAGKVDDILAIEENIRTLQEEIESQEGQLKFLDDQVTYSTLEINLFTEKNITQPTVVEDTFFQRSKISLANGWNMLVSCVLWCIMQWPWCIVIILLIVMIRAYVRRRKK